MTNYFDLLTGPASSPDRRLGHESNAVVLVRTTAGNRYSADEHLSCVCNGPKERALNGNTAHRRARSQRHTSNDAGRVSWPIASNLPGAASAAKGRSIREQSVQVPLLPGAELGSPQTATVAVAIARRVRPSDEAVGESWSGLVSGTLPL